MAISLVMDNNVALRSNLQTDRSVSMNIIAKLTAWPDSAKGTQVELLTGIQQIREGADIRVRVAEDPKRKNQIDFDYRRIHDRLRIGGVVALRKARLVSKDLIECKEIDVLSANPNVGSCVVHRGAAVHLHKPSNEKQMTPSKATVAMLRLRKDVRTAEDIYDHAEATFGNAKLFGRVSYFLTGLNKDGDVDELVIPARCAKAEETAEAVRQLLDRDTLSLISNPKYKWTMIPCYAIDLDDDPHKLGKITAQYANVDYGDKDMPMWTRSNIVLTNDLVSWTVADASPPSEDETKSKLLFDLASPAQK